MKAWTDGLAWIDTTPGVRARVSLGLASAVLTRLGTLLRRCAPGRGPPRSTRAVVEHVLADHKPLNALLVGLSLLGISVVLARLARSRSCGAA